MFFCCCPKEQQTQLEENNNKQSLIASQRSFSENGSQEIKTRINSNATRESQSGEQHKTYHKKNTEKNTGHSNEKIQAMITHESLQNREQQNSNKTQNRQKHQNTGIPPNFPKSESIRPFSPRQPPQKNILSSSKKSALWKQQLKSDLVYLNSNCSSYIYMSYRLTKNQQIKEYHDALDYFLSKTSDKMHLIVGKQQMFHNKAMALSKSNFNTIVAVLSNQNRYSDINVGNAEAIFLQDLKGIRWGGISSVVILADSMHSVAEVKDYFDVIFKDLKWENIKKTTFLLPPFMTIEEISTLLFSYFKQYTTNLNLQRASLDLSFDVQLIEGTNLDSCIIIKNRTEQAKLTNAIYDHLKLSIVFFAKQLSQTTQKIFIDFYIQSKQKSLKQYFEMKQFYRKNPSQFLLRMKKIKDMDSKLFTDLQSSPPLKYQTSEQLGIYYIISSKVREDIGKIYNIPQLQKKEVDTPMKKQWDDDATADDFKTTKKVSLDLIAKEELDRIDLDMGLGGDDSEDGKDFGEGGENEEDNIVLNVEETSKNVLENKFN